VAGSGAVVAFAIYKGDGSVHGADLLLVAAVLAAAVGYAEGARLSRELGGWQVISWALVLSAPALAIPAAFALGDVRSVPLQAWLAFAYVSIVSMYLGFFAWYKGLALGGIAAVGQVQLLQPFLTLLFSAMLLGESLDAPTFIAAGVVIASIAFGRRR
jgi:drug/metabolite transporter (DMT)-like permease